jgi:hypothetical protein
MSPCEIRDLRYAASRISQGLIRATGQRRALKNSRSNAAASRSPTAE